MYISCIYMSTDHRCRTAKCLKTTHRGYLPIEIMAWHIKQGAIQIWNKNVKFKNIKICTVESHICIRFWINLQEQTRIVLLWSRLAFLSLKNWFFYITIFKTVFCTSGLRPPSFNTAMFIFLSKHFSRYIYYRQ